MIEDADTNNNDSEMMDKEFVEEERDSSEEEQDSSEDDNEPAFNAWKKLQPSLVIQQAAFYSYMSWNSSKWQQNTIWWTEKGKRQFTICAQKAGLCQNKGFEIYHTKVDYKKNQNLKIKTYSVTKWSV